MKSALRLLCAAACVLFVVGCADLMDKLSPKKESPAPAAKTEPAAPTDKAPPADTTPKTEPTAPADAAGASSLPFDVTIGGQKAVLAAANAPHATIANPVSADAGIEVGVPADMVIINVFPCDAAGAVASGAQPAIIIINKDQKGALNATMDKKPLAAGKYLANVVITEKGTARVMFEVK